MSKHKTVLPYIKTVAATLITAWIVAAVTWSHLIDMLIEALIVYSGQVQPYGGYTLMAAVILSVVTVAAFIYREMKQLNNDKQEQEGVQELLTEFEAS